MKYFSCGTVTTETVGGQDSALGVTESRWPRFEGALCSQARRVASVVIRLLNSSGGRPPKHITVDHRSYTLSRRNGTAAERDLYGDHDGIDVETAKSDGMTISTFLGE